MLERLFEIVDQPYSDADAEWDAFVAAHPQGSLLQTTNWARLKNRFGWTSHRVWLKKEGRLVAGAQVLYKSAAMGVVKFGYVPHGPLVDWDDDDQLSVLFNQLDHSTYQRGVSILKMEPLLWQDDAPIDDWRALCERHGCHPETDTIQPPRTLLVDLRPDEEDILAAMKQKTRYNIRLAARKGVIVREGSVEDIPAFNQLMRVTGQRDQFGVHAPVYYRDAYDLFAPEQAVLLLAEYRQRPLAAAMIFKLGRTAAFLYGGSSNEERNRMPSYAVQWAAIQWARRQGCTHYDLWGIPDQEEEVLEAGFARRNDRLWGVYRFKRGFGGQTKRTVGAIDRAYNKLMYRLYRWRQSRSRDAQPAG